METPKLAKLTKNIVDVDESKIESCHLKDFKNEDIFKKVWYTVDQ